MGKIGRGILGGVSGKVANVVGSRWKGIDYIRAKPQSVANPRTLSQVNQRTKFALVLRFLQPNLNFIKIGYKNYAVKKSQFNSAMSYILNNAIIGVSPDFEIDYSLALLSRGNLTGALNPVYDLTTSGQVQFSWDDNSTDGNALPTDKVMVVAYNPIKGESVYLSGGATRADLSQTVIIPNSYAGDELQLFISFMNAEETQLSNSIYIGSGTAS
ncbi:hypothetical protein BWK63_07425 [Flavobacterium covae]|uniref:DUF6266 family protein n=1 Tax=Flavobacterium covae TaxID=2906076 RepID=A0ABW8PKQ4_9FLAO|nr:MULTISPECIES: DUF6266 family protein [Flavobacterium]OWP81134.1 hypothetical protein BWK63_07425 [Flavobacterium covae]POR22774.1 hypothetical protein BWK57_04830 [Flavobacterium columnare]